MVKQIVAHVCKTSSTREENTSEGALGVFVNRNENGEGGCV